MKRHFILLVSVIVWWPLAGQQIVRAEYFTDVDPGYGNGTTITITPGSDVETTINIPLSGLEPGMHTLYARVRENNGIWSHTFRSVFLLQGLAYDPPSPVNRIEYFLDTDPGFGMGTPVSFQTGAEVELTVAIPLDNLSDGMHTLYVRTRDESGRWGMVHHSSFVKFFEPEEDALVTRLEYFINEDPGFGKGTPVELNTPKESVMKYFLVAPALLQAGTNTLYIRALDTGGHWGMVYTTRFEVVQTEPCAPPTNLVASNVTETTASLAWTQSGTASKWDLLWVPDGLDYTEEGTVGAAVTDNPHSVSSLIQATLYDFYVRTLCADGQVSQWASPGKFHTLPLPVNQLTLSANPPSGGTVSGQGLHAYGTNVTVTASPGTNFAFDSWTGDTEYLNSTTSASATIKMPAKPVALTANFRDVTGIPELYDNSLKIYPNPASNRVMIEFANPGLEQLTIRLININGQIVAEKIVVSLGLAETALDLTGLSPGLYTLIIRGERLNVTRKLIVEP
jgi:hypothetical protein